MVGASNSSALARGWGQGCEWGATGVRCWATAVGPACWWCAESAATLGMGNAQPQRSHYRTGTRNPDPGSSATPSSWKRTSRLPRAAEFRAGGWDLQITAAGSRGQILSSQVLSSPAETGDVRGAGRLSAEHWCSLAYCPGGLAAAVLPILWAVNRSCLCGTGARSQRGPGASSRPGLLAPDFPVVN